MQPARYLIVNADDFGQSSGINRGIIEAHEHGIVTSASLMVRWPAAEEAAAYARAHPELSLGIHIDLEEWKYSGGNWHAVYQVVRLDDAEAVAEEITSQFRRFRALAGSPPTHIDSHQHVHLREPVRTVVTEESRRLRVPLRDINPAIRYCGEFYGQTIDGSTAPGLISVDRLIALLGGLSASVTELSCHPGNASELDTMYREERLLEQRALCDPKLRRVLPTLGIELCSFNSEIVRALMMKGSDGTSE